MPVDRRIVRRFVNTNQFPVAQDTGGIAGHARGGATVHLSDDGEDTLMRYEAQAEVGGKQAQFGGRLIESAAKKLAGQFFGKLAAVVGADILIRRLSSMGIRDRPPSPRSPWQSGYAFRKHAAVGQISPGGA
jgi:hypothetical protein